MRAETLHAIVLVALVAGLGLSLFAGAETNDKALQHDCSVNPFFSCAKVDQSGQTTTLGIPDYLIGIGGFVVMIAIDIPLYRSWRPELLYLLTAVSAGGLLVSFWLAYVELFRIDALCPVCLSAYLSNLVAFVAALTLVAKARSGAGEPVPAATP